MVAASLTRLLDSVARLTVFIEYWIPVIVEELLSTAFYTIKETPFNKSRKGVF
jgi:hypothetical protein